MSPSANDCPSTSYTSQSSHGPMPHFSSTPEQANVQLLARQAAASCEYSLSRPPDRDAGTNSEGQFSSFGAWPGRTRLRECLETPQAIPSSVNGQCLYIRRRKTKEIAQTDFLTILDCPPLLLLWCRLGCPRDVFPCSSALCVRGVVFSRLLLPVPLLPTLPSVEELWAAQGLQA